MTNFRRIKTEFSNREKYSLSALRLFSDNNRYIERNDQDHDAKLRMGLVGHCADEQYDPSKNIERESRIQGFNAIDLLHTVMLVDDKSSFINDPPQLIQGPGRLRCLNRVRLSTLFCHSSEKLKFDIELLQKGNYIDAYNKVMEENNKKSPEELGDEILKTIDKLIKDRVSGKIKNNQNLQKLMT
ncbi:MAG: hypothetical protein PG981_000493 [Wolbachia endosymbiont of Ctenocephalides orientis wCori]|nr:MAG: hypothetical protein PG981_000493 [Wolbachia endosymbiont of Ctenocephalides orientis wCori]